MATIVLTETWRSILTGVIKHPGTEMTFSKDSEELKAILEAGVGTYKMKLPNDLPGRELLLKAGYDSVQSLAEIQDWTCIKGIGAKTAEELNTYFNIKEEA